MRASAVVLLVIALFLQWLPHWESGHQFMTMPIFTPVSLQYEKQMRNGEKPMNISQAMEVIYRLDVNDGKIRKEDLLRLKEDRKRMLALRNQRHALNVEMMELAVVIADQLTPEQWQMIISKRDAIQSQVEMTVFDDLLRSLD